MIALLLVGCGATAVVTWLATRGGGSSGPIASTADAGTVVVTPPPADAGELTAEDLASLLDAGRQTSPPPMDAAVVVAERPKADRPKPDRLATSGSAKRTVETKHADTKEPVRPPPDPTPEPIATEEPPKPVEEPAPPPLQFRIEFQPNDFDLPGGHEGKLDQIAQHMAKFPRVRLLIVGNAEPDETQKPENLAIARANRVMMLLINRRVGRDRITLDGNANGGRNVVITTR